jgi:hypothetical protein
MAESDMFRYICLCQPLALGVKTGIRSTRRGGLLRLGEHGNIGAHESLQRRRNVPNKRRALGELNESKRTPRR